MYLYSNGYLIPIHEPSTVIAQVTLSSDYKEITVKNILTESQNETLYGILLITDVIPEIIKK